MKLNVIGSNSAGNCYVLETHNEALVIEAGRKLSDLKKAIDYNISKIRGVLVSHLHADHAGFIPEYTSAGLTVYTNAETISHYGIKRNAIATKPRQVYQAGGFKFMPFDVVHDVKCFGFLIEHDECGKTVFITDTHYSPVKFKGLNNIILEANYSDAILDNRITRGDLHPAQYVRIKRSHMSLETAIKMLQANDLTTVNNIVLIHLSDGNSDEKGFVNKVSALTGKSVYAASKGLVIEFNKTGI